jgi:hypothetical protein
MHPRVRCSLSSVREDTTGQVHLWVYQRASIHDHCKSLEVAASCCEHCQTIESDGSSASYGEACSGTKAKNLQFRARHSKLRDVGILNDDGLWEIDAKAGR